VFQDARGETPDGMYPPINKAELVLGLSLEGNSTSTVERVTGVHHTTILGLELPPEVRKAADKKFALSSATQFTLR
jgi:hypothetical protein